MLSDAIQDGGDEVEEKKYQKTDAVALFTYPLFSCSLWNLKWTVHSAAMPPISLDALELPAAVSSFA